MIESKSRRNLSLLVLTIQNTALVIMMKLSKLNSSYINSTAVFHMEFIKLFTCILLAFISHNHEPKSSLPSHSLTTTNTTPTTTTHTPPQTTTNTTTTSITSVESGFWKLSVPALLYYIQNNLLYVAVDNLDSLSFQILYQLKIITTALFSVTMLNRKLSPLKCFSLLLLFIGVILVQLNTPTVTRSQSSQSISSISSSNTSTSYTTLTTTNTLIGVCAVLISAVTSGFSGVYFEKILKSSSYPTSSTSTSTTTTSENVWIRNIQLGIFSCSFATLNLFLSDYSSILKVGFFAGYTPMTWAVIVNQAVGGLVVAVVVKYADNILKGFATSASIILGGIISLFFFHLDLNFAFLFGASLVIYAVYLYSLPDDTIKLKT